MPSSAPSAVGSIGPITVSSASPIATATAPFVLKTATPVPAATAFPTGAANSVVSRPLANGDTFAYAGTSTESFVYTGTTPSPSASVTTTIAQNTTVATGKTYNGTSGLDEFTTAETDATSRQTTTISTNAYYGFGTSTGPTDPTTGVVQTPLTYYGSTSSGSNGETLATTLTSPGFGNNSGTVDLLPEANSPTWTNGIAEKIVQNESDGFSATRTYNADGSYTENDTYPQTTAASPQPAAETATIVQASDGSGSYSVPLFSGSNVSITYAKPKTSGEIDITFDDNMGDTFVEQVSAWFPQPLSTTAPAYSEIDRDNGAVTYPSACGLSSGKYGTTGNELEQKYTRIDTILGDLEYFDQLTYVATNGVAACVQLSDVTYSFYDFSGQTNTDLGPGFQGGNSPYQTTTIATTLGVTGNPTLNAVARNADLASAGPAGLAASAVANARANFLTTVDHFRAQRERKLFAHVRASLARFHR